MSAVATPSGPSVVDGEFAMTAADFRRITAMLHEDSGIVMHEGKATLVYSRLAKRVRALGLGDFRAYCRLVGSASGSEERQRMLSALTTNLTRFFREPHHFSHLQAAVLPPLAEAARRGARVRLWSAACSNGAEPYSIAMALLHVMPDAAEHDVRILATDIDREMVEAGRRGSYDAQQISGAPPGVLERWMTRGEDRGRTLFTPGPEMRRLVGFGALNLIGPWPMSGGFDAIFCRNVAIYFDAPTQDELWGRFAAVLSPGGYLYIGHSERVSGAAAARLRPAGVTTYRTAGNRP